MLNMMQMVKSKVVLALLLLLAAGGPALATPAAPAFDSAEIIALIATYSAAAVALVGAFLLARWGLHALNLLRPRG